MRDKVIHWDTVYSNKEPHEVSWTQIVPQNSLNLISSLQLNYDAEIIDVGAGDSNLVDNLLELGYRNITVLDISKLAIEKLKARLGAKGANVKFIVSNILDFNPTQKYDLWHDRATFHFLNSKENQLKYVNLVNKSVEKHMILSTFSINGPLRCSGLDVQQYSCNSIKELFQEQFLLNQCFESEHVTPFQTQQKFIYSLFNKK